MYQMQTTDTARYQPFGKLSWQPHSKKSGVDGVDNVGRQSLGRGPVSDLSAVYPDAVVASSADLGWQDIRILHIRNEQREMDLPPMESHCIVVHLEPSGYVTADINGHTFHDFLTPGDVTIIPAGVPSRWTWNENEPQETVHLYLQTTFVQEIARTAGLDPGQLSIEPQIAIRDEQISHMAMSLLYEVKAANVIGRLYADSVASALAIQLVRRYSCLKDVGIRKGGMAPHKLRRALEFIGQNLDQQQCIPLDVVAQEVGMSRYHFSRVFKESMGLSPINYIVRQRIERAKKLLTETDLPIADVALQSGFSCQSHFTTFFRKLVGLTPRSFRRQM